MIKKLKRRKPIYMLVLIGIFFISVSYRLKEVKEEQTKEINSFYKEYSKKGIPVKASLLSKKETDFYETITVIRENTGIYLAWIDKSTKNKLKKGQRVFLKIKSDIYKGKIQQINNQVSYTYGLYKVKISFSKDPQVDWSLAKVIVKTKKTISVSKNILDCKQDKCFIWQVIDGVAYKTKVETGFYDDEKIEILSEINIKNPVIVSNTRDLLDGTRVQESIE